MRFSIHFVAASALAFASVASVQATDYSTLFQPGYARVFLLTAERGQQAECAGLALYFRETRAGFSKDGANRLVDGVFRRLAADLGDDKIARELIDAKADNHSSLTYDTKTRAEITGMIEGHCRQLFDQAAKGQAELEAALGPVPMEPLALPDPGQCLAVASYAAENGIDGAKDFEQALTEYWMDRVTGAELATRKANLQTAIGVLRSGAPSSDQLHGMIFACTPTMKDVLANGMVPQAK